jgi:hypothetical protein
LKRWAIVRCPSGTDKATPTTPKPRSSKEELQQIEAENEDEEKDKIREKFRTKFETKRVTK